MNPQTKAPTVIEPFEVHFLGPLTVAVDRRNHASMEYGCVLTINQENYEASRDRNGRSWIDTLLDDEEAQIRCWGRVRVRRGGWPDDLPRIEPGSQRWWDAADGERREAHRIEDEAERGRALRAIRAKYGSQPTSRTLATVDVTKRDREAWQ